MTSRRWCSRADRWLVKPLCNVSFSVSLIFSSTYPSFTCLAPSPANLPCVLLFISLSPLPPPLLLYSHSLHQFQQYHNIISFSNIGETFSCQLFVWHKQMTLTAMHSPQETHHTRTIHTSQSPLRHAVRHLRQSWGSPSLNNVIWRARFNSTLFLTATDLPVFTTSDESNNPYRFAQSWMLSSAFTRQDGAVICSF